jgi:hypothetical protein
MMIELFLFNRITTSFDFFLHLTFISFIFPVNSLFLSCVFFMKCNHNMCVERLNAMKFFLTTSSISTEQLLTSHQGQSATDLKFWIHYKITLWVISSIPRFLPLSSAQIGFLSALQFMSLPYSKHHASQVHTINNKHLPHKDYIILVHPITVTVLSCPIKGCSLEQTTFEECDQVL